MNLLNKLKYCHFHELTEISLKVQDISMLPRQSHKPQAAAADIFNPCYKKTSQRSQLNSIDVVHIDTMAFHCHPAFYGPTDRNTILIKECTEKHNTLLTFLDMHTIPMTCWCVVKQSPEGLKKVILCNFFLKY